MEINIKPLSPSLIDDYLFFFDNMIFVENPHWDKCYCFSFHFVGKNEEWIKENNRASVIEFIKQGKMKGYLAYDGEKPVGWCNANDRNNYQRLLKYYDLVDNKADKVCSIVCFLIHPEYRRQGISQKILEQICKDYSLMDYDYIEAYPGKGNLSCEKLYKGSMDMYQKFDFKPHKEYDDYFVFRKMIE